MKFPRLFGKQLSPRAELKQIYERLSNDIDGSSSLQYAVVDAYLSLRSQGNRDGWMNWSDWYEECIDLLVAHVPSGAAHDVDRVREDLEAIREAGQTGADEGRMGYEELDRVAPDVVRWWHKNRKLVQLPEGADSWLDTLENRTG